MVTKETAQPRQLFGNHTGSDHKTSFIDCFGCNHTERAVYNCGPPMKE